MNTISIILYVVAGILFYFYTKIKKQYLAQKGKEDALPLLQYIGKFLVTDIEDFVLTIGIAYWLLTGHTIVGLEANLTTEFACFGTGILIPYVGVNLVLASINMIPGIKTGDRSGKRVSKAK